MNIIDNELTVIFDVDDTLVLWGKPIGEETRRFIDPHTKKVEYLKPHDEHIQILKQQKGRGYHVTVWSAAGWAWAKTVIDTLGIQDYVDEIRSKPVKVFDDVSADKILNVIYIKHRG